MLFYQIHKIVLKYYMDVLLHTPLIKYVKQNSFSIMIPVLINYVNSIFKLKTIGQNEISL